MTLLEGGDVDRVAGGRLIADDEATARRRDREMAAAGEAGLAVGGVDVGHGVLLAVVAQLAADGGADALVETEHGRFEMEVGDDVARTWRIGALLFAFERLGSRRAERWARLLGSGDSGKRGHGDRRGQRQSAETVDRCLERKCARHLHSYNRAFREKFIFAR